MATVRVDPYPPWLGLPRAHWLELEDLPWWPAPWRDAATRYLALALRLSGHADLVAERLRRFAERTGSARIVDLGSGGGGVMATVVARSPDLHVHLTDLHPNVSALRAHAEASGGRLTATETPVDATRVPPELAGARAMVNAFHHLPPDAARAVLQDAVDRGRPITVVEVVSRRPMVLLGLLTAPLSFALTLPLQGFRPWIWLWTLVVPVMPLFVLWDGVASWRRIYHPEELAGLVAGLRGTDGWTFEIGTFPLGSAPGCGVFLEAYPPAA